MVFGALQGQGVQENNIIYFFKFIDLKVYVFIGNLIGLNRSVTKGVKLESFKRPKGKLINIMWWQRSRYTVTLKEAFHLLL